MSEQEMMLKELSTIDFAIVDLNLYMDTHPDDQEINEKLNTFKEKSNALRKEYESKYGQIKPNYQEKNQWSWISDPWPWNNNEGAEN